MEGIFDGSRREREGDFDHDTGQDGKKKTSREPCLRSSYISSVLKSLTSLNNRRDFRFCFCFVSQCFRFEHGRILRNEMLLVAARRRLHKSRTSCRLAVLSEIIHDFLP